MIYKDFLKCYSYDAYIEAEAEILPDTIIFNVEEGNEKLIFQGSEMDFVPSGGNEGQILQKAAKGYQWANYRAFKKVTTLNNLPINCSFILAEIGSTDAITLSGTIPAGQEVHIIVHNTSSASITITLPNTGSYINFSEDTLTVDGDGYTEINLLSDGEKVYIRTI